MWCTGMMFPLRGLGQLRCFQCGLQMPPPAGYTGGPLRCPFLAAPEVVAERPA
jgi:hypothetical protein